MEAAAEAALTEIVVALVEEAQIPWEEVGQTPSPEEAAGEATMASAQTRVPWRSVCL